MILPKPLTLRQGVVAVLICLSLCAQGTSVLAATTGAITGTIVDMAAKAPIARATVTASSPSQTARATTDSAGRFTIFSLTPDAYTISVQKEGYEPYSAFGVNVFAGQQQNFNVDVLKALTTIARVTTRSQADLLNSARTTDAYTITPATQAAASALGGGGSLNQAYSALASAPGVYIPQNQSGMYQSVYIRGGNYSELGYELDGIPIQRSFDQYPSSALSALGQQNLQVYAGSGPLDAQSSGLAGFIDQVIKTGTYPGYAHIEGSLGSPTFYHQGEIEVGGASPNRNFSYYVASAGYNQEFRFLDNYNGAVLNNTIGNPYNLVKANCAGLSATIGCYTNGAGEFGFPDGPAGYAFGPFQFGANNQVADRESIVNLHFGIPHKDGTRDDIQLLYDNSLLTTIFQNSINDWAYAKNDVINGTATYNGVTYPASETLLGGDRQNYINSSIYTGPVGVPLTPSLVRATQNYYFPFSNATQKGTGVEIPFAQRDTTVTGASAEKIQYTKSIGSNAFVRLFGYALYSNLLDDGPNSNATNLVGSNSADYELNAHTRGLGLTISDQVNPQNQLTLNGGYDYANTVRWNNSSFLNNGSTVAYAVSSAHPANGTCYSVAGGVSTPVFCGAPGAGGASQYVLNGFGKPGLSQGTSTDPTVAGIAGNSCGGAPCEYLTVNNGISGSYNTVAPAFSNLSFDDRFRPNQRLLLDLGVHYDDFRFNLQNTTVPAGPEPNTATPLQRQFWTNVFVQGNCQNSLTLELVPKSVPGAACPSGQVPVTFSDVSPSVNDYHAFEPRFSGTYTVDRLTVLRASYSKIAQAPDSSYQQYNGAAGQLPLVANFYPIGYRDPAHSVGPSYSYNTDFSVEHQFKGTDASLELTPFYRSTDGQIFDVILDPKTNFSSGLNVGKTYIEGAELALHKGDFARDGFAGQLSYTYTYARTHYDSLPNGQTVIGPVNSGIIAYNAYTSFCGTHRTDVRCGGGHGGPGNGGIVAAPCYTPTVTTAVGTTGGAPTACRAGDIANPYYNSPVASLFDPNGFYTAYNQTVGPDPGTTNNTVNSSYVTPHVVALLLQYRHGPFTITPSFQLSAGDKYGSPTTSFGISPNACGGNLGTAGVSNDNRYPSGLPQGATPANEYLAQTCGGATIYTPDRYTGSFDNFGQFTEPSIFTGNVALNYRFNKKVSLNAVFVNVLDQCFGGSKVPWNTAGPKIGCSYSSGAYAGNYYNPGNTFQGRTIQYPYAPVFGNVFQQVYGVSANPLQAYFSLNVSI